MYRIKTEEEFIEEYGPNWRRRIGWNPRGLMDYLCGEVLSESQVESIRACRSLRIDDSVRGFAWIIKFENIKEILPRNEILNYEYQKFKREYDSY